jgi:hypothetical protein
MSIRPSPAVARSRSARALALNRADVTFRTGNHFFTLDFPQAQGPRGSRNDRIRRPRRHRPGGRRRGERRARIRVPDYALHGDLVVAPARGGRVAQLEA